MEIYDPMQHRGRAALQRRVKHPKQMRAFSPRDAPRPQGLVIPSAPKAGEEPAVWRVAA
jgi:hypothetical protein